MQVIHGGRLAHYVQSYGGDSEDWIDLSTGIAPIGYPVPSIPAQYWRRLPDHDAALLDTARGYYGVTDLLAIAGSQAIIQQIPTLLQMGNLPVVRVWLPEVGYKEHQHAWAKAGVECVFYRASLSLTVDELRQHDVVVIINPNNPSGEYTSVDHLELIQQRLAQLNGMLIVDEAFMDCTPHHTLIGRNQANNLLVLRSIGKFFGLAGLRVGFLHGASQWLMLAQQMLGPWSVSGPAQYVVQRALADTDWHQQQRRYLDGLSNRLAKLLNQYWPNRVVSTPLFHTVQVANASDIHERLCRKKVLCRLCDEQDALRFGLPTAPEFEKLSHVLKEIN